jgi:hypothetical protein
MPSSSFLGFWTLLSRSTFTPLHKDYTFVLESTGPSVAALALDCARAKACQQLLALAPVGSNGEDVEVEGSKVEEVVKLEVVVPKVPVVPWPKPGGSKSVPGEWNKLAGEKKEAERKLVDNKEEAERKMLVEKERKMLVEKGMVEEQEVEEMVDRPIKNTAVVVDSNEEDEEALVADLVPRATLVTSLLKGRKVEVVLPPPWVTAGQVKGTMVLPFAEQFLLTGVTVPAILTMDNKAKEGWSVNDKMDVDELEGTPVVSKCKAVEVANESMPK